ncbi:MAG: tetratricopeptide repeat protein [Bacteroidetes bacterium]|nr:MAG: tetratricopeptide repeat protein [Bacteroidota bacterium]
MRAIRSTYIQISLLALWGLLFLPQLAQAAEPEALFEAANEAYIAGDYPQAVALYDSVQALGYHSAHLYFNLGNAHYKLSHLAPALLNYERCLQLDPTHEDAAYNLRLARLRVVDKLEPVPDFFLTQWIRDFVNGQSSATWGWIAIGLLWLALGAGALLLWAGAPQLRRVGFFGGIALVLLAFVATGLSLHRRSLEQDSGWGIIFSSNAYVKEAPAGQTDLTILHEGAKVRYLDQQGDWVKISLKVQDNQLGEVVDLVGFVPTTAIRKI